MIIGIDGNEANVAHRVGSNRYAYGILKGIYSLSPSGLHFVIYLKSAPLADMPRETDWWHYRVIGPAYAWTQWRLPLDLQFHTPRPHVFYSPGHYAPRFSPIPTVVSIMDLAFLKMPQLFLKYKRGTKQLTDWTAYSVKKSSRLIAISQHTKKDIIHFYHYPADRITIAYPGIDASEFSPATPKQLSLVRSKYHLPTHYILHVGTLQPRKNIERLIQAFEQLPPKYKHYHLVLAGQSGWMTESIEESITKSKVSQRIDRIGFVDQPDLPAILSGAACLVMVGLYEGFGMPPAEALACHTLPIVSNNTSLPEVVGDAGISVDPYSVASISHGIIVALRQTSAQRQKRLEVGRAHIKQFDWQASAQQIINTLKEINV